MEFAIALDPTAPHPLHRQLYAALRQAILSKRLLPGQQLPSTRTLARSLGISRATVTLSYEHLLSEGYLETVAGSGTFVCPQLPDELLEPRSQPAADPASHPAIQLSTYGARLADSQLERIPDPVQPISFGYGSPALDQFPIELWRRLLTRHCQPVPALLDYAFDPGGYLPLREAIAQYLARSRAVYCQPEQVIVVNGSQQALDLVARLLIDTGDRVGMEDPGYLGARRTFLTYGAELYPIPVDALGMVVRHLEAVGGIKLIYITPSHQFPTGAVLSLPRRIELLVWAQQQGAFIIEDDYDSEYRYGGRGTGIQENRPVPALQGLNRSNSVLYMGTFSKVLFPALRLGYLVVPSGLVKLFTRAKGLTDRQSPLLEQRVLTDFIQEGHLERHIRRMRTLYDRRRRSLVQALTEHLGEQITILGDNAGIHLMVRIKTPLSDAEVVRRAATVGVGIVPASPYYLRADRAGEFIFGYSQVEESQIQEGIRRLGSQL